MEEFELLENDKVVDVIDFGRPEVGSKNQKILQLHNKSKTWMINNIQLDITPDKDVKIQYPKQLKPDQYGEIRIDWNPKFERRLPLEISQMFTGELEIG